MNTLDAQTTVGELVVEQPGRARVFERHGIDFCCGGKTPLSDACAKKSIDIEQIIGELNAADKAPATRDEADWSKASLSNLIDHIVDTHHAYLVLELPRLSAIVAKVAEVHGERHPELAQVRSTYEALREELESHMMKEEHILFPAIRMMEQSGGGGGLPFGSINNPIHMMEFEHDSAGRALAQLRALTHDFTTPADGCNTYRAMLHGLERLEADLHLHIHKENNILFPRAAALEE